LLDIRAGVLAFISKQEGALQEIPLNMTTRILPWEVLGVDVTGVAVTLGYGGHRIAFDREGTMQLLLA
jgi:hypothetical protein